jgi:hypothetical protein
MNSTNCLRRQAELCLRLAQLCSDQPLLQHLNFLAARYHETALRTEFGVAQDVDAQSGPEDVPGSTVLRH